VESSYAVCEDLVFGRMSFKGFNPEIEKLMRKAEREKNPSLKEDEILQQDKEADVQAAEVVQRYSLTKTINRKFGGHNRGTPRRRGFKRPAED
jgi:M-phase phosphoprotein 6, animal type